MNVTEYLELLARRPLILDGAMGTAIYDRGVFVNTCYEELNLTNPELISEIHRGYVDAGARMLLTNTFGANHPKLRSFGLGDKLLEINQAACRLAREAAIGDVLVAGDVGPCQEVGSTLSEAMEPELEAAFREQTSAMAEAGVDLIFLETFSDVRELRLAARVASETGLPVHASFSVDGSGETATGVSALTVMELLEADDNVTSLGLNCAVGPALLLQVVQTMLPRIHKPLIVKPNAGFPQNIGGRMLYLSSPEYFTEKAKEFIRLGVRGIGGCCGTTAEHIKVLAQTITCLTEFKQPTGALESVRDDSLPSITPAKVPESRMATKLEAGRMVAGIEVLSPKNPDMAPMIAKVRQCQEAGVDVINIPDGPRATARVAPLMAAAMIKQAGLNIEPVPHYCCRDRNLLGMQSDILAAAAAGIHNLLVITGDPPKTMGAIAIKGVFDLDSIGLTRLISNLNQGMDLSGNPIDPPTSLLVGVGVDPGALNLEHEINRFYGKIEAGAAYAITQPVFDPDVLLRFLDIVDKAPRRIPVMAGLFPLISYRNAEFMRNEVPGVVVPDGLMERFAACEDRDAARQVGIDTTRKAMAKLADRVAGFQVSAPLGSVDTALAVLEGYIG